MLHKASCSLNLNTLSIQDSVKWSNWRLRNGNVAKSRELPIVGEGQDHPTGGFHLRIFERIFCRFPSKSLLSLFISPPAWLTLNLEPVGWPALACWSNFGRIPATTFSSKLLQWKLLFNIFAIVGIYRKRLMISIWNLKSTWIPSGSLSNIWLRLTYISCLVHS